MKAPKLPINKARKDFESIFKTNIVQMEIIRNSNTQAGDYFYDDEQQGQTLTTIELNIQGQISNAYNRENQGIIGQGRLHAYARWNADILETDMLRVSTAVVIGTFVLNRGDIFKIENFNKSSVEGKVVFQEFDLKKVTITGYKILV